MRIALIINGKVVAVKNVLADGSIQNITFETEITKSSWVALRIMPSSHTNPIFVLIDNQPIRASKKSAEWCLNAVDQCWTQKFSKISNVEKVEAAKTYERAKQAYRKIIAESIDE